MIYKAGGNYKTKSGHEARIYATDGNEPVPIHGAVKLDNGWVPLNWREDGTGNGNLDLVPAKVWVVVDNYFDSEDEALESMRERGGLTVVEVEKTWHSD